MAARTVADLEARRAARGAGDPLARLRAHAAALPPIPCLEAPDMNNAAALAPAPLPVVYRLKNNPDARGFYAAAYVSHPVADLPDMRTLILIEKRASGTKRGAEKHLASLRAAYGEAR